MIRKGTYVLFMFFKETVDTDVGALGRCHLEPGMYCYVGSAMGGLDQRVSRHLSSEKAMRWHIDRITVLADRMEAYESYPDPVGECELARLASVCGASCAIEGFGCSDCHCRTHLFKLDPDHMSDLIHVAGLHPFPKAGQ